MERRPRSQLRSLSRRRASAGAGSEDAGGAANGRSASALLWRRCCHSDQETTAPISTSCTTASVAAVPMSPSCVARRQISTSTVDVPASPSTRITPNDVNVKTNTTAAPARMAGHRSGRVISRNALQGDAPSVAAAASRSGDRCCHTAPTVRTTTARLNITWATRMAGTPRSHPAGRRARTAAPMTTVGRTKAAVSSPASSRRPTKRKRERTYAGRRPARTVSTVLTTACHSVNHKTCHVEERVNVASTVAGVSPRASSVRNGQA